MDRAKKDETSEANRKISRPAERTPSAKNGKILAGQRAELALNPTGDQGRGESETEQALKRASRNDDRE